MRSEVKFGIITPTYQRERLLKFFMRKVKSQSHRSWNLAVIHDGVGGATRALVKKYSERDPRVQYLETPSRANDFGVTPRLLGLAEGLKRQACDYLVFWDDDNYFYSNALRTIARSLALANYPDLLLVPIHFRETTLPAAGSRVDSLGERQLDTANFVLRSDLARQYYQAVAARCKSGDNPYIQDYLLFQEIRRAVPSRSIAIAQCKPIALYDGMLRDVRFRHIRKTLRLPPLHLERFAWFRNFLARTSKK